MRSILLVLLLALGLRTEAVAATTKTLSVKMSAGEDVITSLLRYKFLQPYAVTVAGNTLSLKFSDIFVDFENNSAVLFFKAGLKYTNAGLPYEKQLTFSRSFSVAELQFSTQFNALKIANLLADQFADLPAWVRSELDKAVSPILPVQEAVLALRRTQDRQITDEYPLYATTTFGLKLAFADDRLD